MYHMMKFNEISFLVLMGYPYVRAKAVSFHGNSIFSKTTYKGAVEMNFFTSLLGTAYAILKFIIHRWIQMKLEHFEMLLNGV